MDKKTIIRHLLLLLSGATFVSLYVLRLCQFEVNRMNFRETWYFHLAKADIIIPSVLSGLLFIIIFIYNLVISTKEKKKKELTIFIGISIFFASIFLITFSAYINAEEKVAKELRTNFYKNAPNSIDGLRLNSILRAGAYKLEVAKAKSNFAVQSFWGLLAMIIIAIAAFVGRTNLPNSPSG